MSRVPPHDLEAEQALLGAILLAADGSPLSAALEAGVRAEDFYKPSHGLIFQATVDLYEKGQPRDPVIVADELRRRDELDKAGGPSALVALQANTPAIGNAPRYAGIVAEHAKLRRLIAAAGRIAEAGYSVPENVDGAVDAARALLDDVERRRQGRGMVGPKEMLGAVLDSVEAAFDRGEPVTGLPTGYRDLDEMTLGLHPGQLAIVGGRPSSGKTAFSLGLAAHAVLLQHAPTLVASMEMSHEEVGQRLLSAEGGVDAKRMMGGRLGDGEWQRLSHVVGRFADSPLHVLDQPSLTVAELRSRARQVPGLRLVVVDYLQLMRHRAESRQVEVSEVSRGLKVLARDLQVPVVALSQVGRGVEARANKRPTLADLKETGSLEQDADLVVLIYRPEMYDPRTPDRGMAEIIVAKQRNGPTGTVKLAFVERYARFANMARGQDEV